MVSGKAAGALSGMLLTAPIIHQSIRHVKLEQTAFFSTVITFKYDNVKFLETKCLPEACFAKLFLRWCQSHDLFC